MKKLYTLFSIIILITLNLHAQLPQKLPEPVEAKLKHSPFSDTFNKKLNKKFNLNIIGRNIKSDPAERLFLQGWIIEEQVKVDFTYNNDALPSGETYYQWDNNQWVPYAKTEHQYQSNRIIQTDDFNWYENKWMVIWRTKYYYDDDGSLTALEVYQVEEDGQNLIGQFRLEFINENDELHEIYYLWDTEWVEFLKIEKTFEDDLITEKRDFLWDSDDDEWLQVSKTEYTYEGETLVEELESLIAGDMEIPSSRILYEHNAMLYPILETHSEWEIPTSKWINTSQYVMDYTPEGLNILYEEYEWNANTDEWDGIDREEIEWDSAGNPVTQILFVWDETDRTWEEDAKSEYVYDLDVSGEDVVAPMWYFFINKLDQVNDYIWEDNEWLPVSQMVLIYVPESVVATRDTDLKVSVYPNPVSDYLYIQTGGRSGHFELYNLQGQKMISSEFNEEVSLKTEMLIPGYYIYRLKLDGQILNGKIVKK
jgi:hypothetical protein